MEEPGTYYTYYTWYLPWVSLAPSPGCRVFNLAGYSDDFAGDSYVTVDLYENTNVGWQEVGADTVDVTGGGALVPGSSVSSWGVPGGVFGTGEYEAWLTDSAGRGGATFSVTCT